MDEEIKKKYRTKITINPNMRDYSKDPFIVRKVAEAEATLKKYGLPREFIELSKAGKKKKTSA